MQFRIAQSALAAFLFLALPFFAPPSVRADSFAVESCTKYDRHSVRDPAQNSACMVGRGTDSAIIHKERIIVLAPAHIRRAEAYPEFDPFHSRHGKNQLSNAVLDTVKHRVSQTTRHIGRNAFHHSAD